MHSNWLTAVISNAAPEELPVLARTRREFAALLADELAPLRKIAMFIMGDPALALRVLQRANAVPHRHFSAEVALLEDAAHMLGTQTLVHLEAEAKVADAVLTDARLASYQRSAGRAVLAAVLAHDWAEIDHDRFPAEVSLAALLNHLGELFLLAHGDPRINRYLDLVEINHLLPHEAEYLSLGESLEELGHLLAQRWKLPEMVREAMRARNAQYPRALCVMLATQIARHAFSSWQRPTLMSDLRLVADLLALELLPLMRRINTVLIEFNYNAGDYGVKPLKLLPIENAIGISASWSVGFCLAPRADEVAACRAMFTAEQAPFSRDEVLIQLVRTLHHGVGLNRVVFARYHPRLQTLSAEFLVGTDFEPLFNRFRLVVDDDSVIQELLAVSRALWVNNDNAAELLPRIPSSVLELIGVKRFFMASLWVNTQVIGVVYADRRNESCQLDVRSFETFAQLVKQAGLCLARLNTA
ncbi:histidine kinase [Chromatium weissei]|nr:histidine kinase [Chromatium weissei]